MRLKTPLFHSLLCATAILLSTTALAQSEDATAQSENEPLVVDSSPVEDADSQPVETKTTPSAAPEAEASQKSGDEEKVIAALTEEVALAEERPDPTIQKEVSLDPAYELIKLPVMSSFRPSRAVLIAFGNDSIKELGEGSVDLINDRMIAQFSIKKSDLPPSSLLTALLFSPDGESEGTPLISLEDLQRLDLPVCSKKPRLENQQQATLQPGVIQSLVQVRIDRRKNAQERLRDLLSGDFLDTAIRLERGFGLSRGTELSPDLPPLELIERLSHVISATQGYKNHRKLG